MIPVFKSKFGFIKAATPNSIPKITVKLQKPLVELHFQIYYFRLRRKRRRKLLSLKTPKNEKPRRKQRNPPRKKLNRRRKTRKVCSII